MSASSRAPLQTMRPSSMNMRVSAALEGVAGVLLDEEHGGAGDADLADGVHDEFADEGCEPEGGLVGDEDLGRVHEGGDEAEHLLLAAGEQAGGLLAALAEDGKRS